MSRPVHIIYDIGGGSTLTACGKDGESVKCAVGANDSVADLFRYLATRKVHPCSACVREVKGS